MGALVMKITFLNLRTTSLFLFVTLLHFISITFFKPYGPEFTHSDVFDKITKSSDIPLVFEIALTNVDKSSVPSEELDSKTKGDNRLGKTPAELVQKADQKGKNPNIIDLPVPINMQEGKKKTQDRTPIEIDRSAGDIANNSEANNRPPTSKNFNNYFKENDGRKYPVFVYYGGYRMGSKPVGEGFLSYKFDNSSSMYKIKLFAEASGWAKIFLRKPLLFLSEGRVEGLLLKPMYYEVHTPKKGKSFVKVSHAPNSIFFSGKNLGENFSGDIYDPLSLIFQIASLTATGQIFEKNNNYNFQVFNKKKLEKILVTPSPPEDMVLPNGDLVSATKIVSRVQRGKKIGDISFWLDNSFNHHPVRITFENKTKNYSLDFLIQTGVDGTYEPNTKKKEIAKDKKQPNNSFNHPHLKF